MSASGYTPIQIYYSTTAAAVPVNTNLLNGELAINITDGKLYYKNNSGTVTLLASSAGASGDVVGPSSATANGIALFNSTTGKLIKDSAASDGLIYGLTVGRGAGAVASNTAFGTTALASNSTGDLVTAVGFQALYFNTARGQTAIGYQALKANTSGTDNTSAGRESMLSNTTGANNTALGTSALASNTTASNNTAVGYQSLYSNTTGPYNVAVGKQAGYSNTTGQANAFFGYQAGYYTTGDGNTFVGAAGSGPGGSGYLVTTGARNSILGAFSGNQGGLDIRTLSNKVVVSDGDGNIAFHNDVTNVASNPFGSIDVTAGGGTSANILTLSSGTAVTLFASAFSGVFIITDISQTGASAMFIMGGVSTVTRIALSSANNYFPSTSTPTGSETGCYIVSNGFTIKQNSGNNVNYRIISFRTRDSL